MSTLETHRMLLIVGALLALSGCSNNIPIDGQRFEAEPDAPPPEPDPIPQGDCPGGCLLGEVCEEGLCVDLCEGVVCEAPPDRCDDGAAIRFLGDGSCDVRTGECDFDAVRLSTDCEVVGRVCQQNQCVVLCENEGCAQPDAFCDGNTAVTYTGQGVCSEAGECDFGGVERSEDCAAFGEICVDAACREDPAARVLISEVMNNPDGSDSGHEWIEIHNGTPDFVDLSGYALGAGGGNYTRTIVQLSGGLSPGDCFVVGGPEQSERNALPVYDQIHSFSPALQNALDNTTADAIALFDRPAAEIEASTVPIDAVIFGIENVDAFLDPSGEPGSVGIDAPEDGVSMERVSVGVWRLQSAPSPNDCTPLR